MKAITLVPGTTNVRLLDRPEPSIRAADEVKLRVLQVGICGTDRDEAAGGRAVAPPGHSDLVIGHELLGRVVEIGPAVQAVRVGDVALFTVRRGCGQCANCAIDRSDMCSTGNYADRGIHLRDGYQTEFVVDTEAYVVRVPPGIASVAVLTEPMSIAEKAIDEAVRIQIARLPGDVDAGTWLRGTRVLVAGLGPIGLLATIALRLRGASVYGLDVVDAATIRPRLLEQLGGTYVDGRQVNPRAIGEHFPEIELIFEATGIAQLEFELLSALGANGVYVLTGIAGGDRPVTIDGSSLMKALVLRNQVTVGSVNASRAHFALAVSDLERAKATWGGTLDALITDRVAYGEFASVLTTHPADEIKTVIEWSPI